MTMLEQARHCSFGLTKTFFSRSSKSAFSHHDNVRANSTLFIWLSENVGKYAKSNRETSRIKKFPDCMFCALKALEMEA